jgi:hypothetical protein
LLFRETVLFAGQAQLASVLAQLFHGGDGFFDTVSDGIWDFEVRGSRKCD